MTGVQTCALPILKGGVLGGILKKGELKVGDEIEIKPGLSITKANQRSEERRVGKECRSRWSPYH